MARGWVRCAACEKEIPLRTAARHEGSFLCPRCMAATRPGGRARALAGFWTRVEATLIDAFILVPGLIFLLLLLDVAFGVPFFSRERTPLHDRITAAALFSLQFFYYVWFHWRYGATVGKRLLRIRVVRAGGEKLELWRVVLRWAASTYVSFGLTAGIGCLLALFDRERRALHDILCGTLVVYSVRVPKKSRWQAPGTKAPP